MKPIRGTKTADPVDRHAVVLALDRIKMRGDETWYDYYHKALDAIAKLPPVDAVPVVRCEECTCSRPFSAVVIECTLCAELRLKTDYCSYGKRKGDDHHEG